MRNLDVPQTPVEVASVIEQPLPQQAAVKNVLDNWGKIDGAVTIKLGPDKGAAWTRRPYQPPLPALVSFSEDGKTAFVPEDLTLYEVPEVLEALGDHAIIKDPEHFKAKAQEVRALGQRFENAALYIAKRIPTGKYMPEDRDFMDKGILGAYLVYEFGTYGKALQEGTHGESFSHPYRIREFTQKLAQQPDLSAEETDEMDRWLGGDKLYASRRKKVADYLAATSDPSVDDWLQKHPNQHTKGWPYDIVMELVEAQPTTEGKITELERQNTLKQMLMVTEKAHQLGYRANRRQAGRQLNEYRERDSRFRQYLGRLPTHGATENARADYERREGRPLEIHRPYYEVSIGDIPSEFDQVFPRPLRDKQPVEGSRFKRTGPTVHDKFVGTVQSNLDKRIEEPKEHLVEALSPNQSTSGDSSQERNGWRTKVKNALATAFRKR